MNKPRLVLECSKEHGGDIEKAKEMIRKAKECGGDAVKFQAYNLDDMNKDHLNYKRNFNSWFNLLQLKELKQYADDIGIDFYCSVFSLSMIQPLAEFTDEIKIPSTFLSKEGFVKECIKNFKTIHISTGMHTKADINKYNRIYWTYTSKFREEKELIFYHCTSLYPAPFDKARLGRLKDEWAYLEGFSDHSVGSRQAILAWLLGVTYVEKHFSLRPNAPSWCNDPEDIETFIKAVESTQEAITDSDLTDEEKRNYEFYKKEFRDLYEEEK